jgi:multidrug resistance efflux pump
MPEMETTGALSRRPPLSRRILSAAGVLAIAATGAAWSGCGEDEADNAQEQINEAVDQAQEQGQEALEEGQEATEEATQEAKEQLDEAEQQLEDQTGGESGGTGYSP